MRETTRAGCWDAQKPWPWSLAEFGDLEMCRNTRVLF